MVKPETTNDNRGPIGGTGYANVESLDRDLDLLKHSVSLQSLSTFEQGKRILIVDDSPDITLTLRIELENSGTPFQVYSYDNPVTALLEFKPNFYDLLIIDVNMPLMDGFELCKKLLQKDINVRVCFMTSGEINMNAVREVHPLKSIGCLLRNQLLQMH
ncbi:MAG: response regulator transcription factor [Nitrososphaeraceae archaeon]